MNLSIYFMILVALAGPAFARTFSRCSLIRELYFLGVPKSELSTWACIAKYQSGYRTQAVSRGNPDGSREYGIFQINSRYWCRPRVGVSYNGCGVYCGALLSKDISASVRCAGRIKAQRGFSAWVVYKRYCRGRLPSAASCF